MFQIYIIFSVPLILDNSTTLSYATIDICSRARAGSVSNKIGRVKIRQESISGLGTNGLKLGYERIETWVRNDWVRKDRIPFKRCSL